MTSHEDNHEDTKARSNTLERLQKILSQAGVASRRASEQLMLEGRVTVNGQTIRELGTKANAARDDIRVDGRRVRLPERHIYLLLNKPKGYVSTRSDPQRRPTVIDLIGTRDYVYPVGRLDFDSEGLLILTNDGDLAAKLTHPRHGVPRVYEARVAGIPDAHEIQRLRRGMVIDGERTGPADVQLVERRGGPVLIIGIREGRNRQVRKMCDSIGQPVDHLRRVAIGPLRDDRMKVGQWRDLTEAEVNKLRAAVTGAASATAPANRLPGASPSAPTRGASRDTPDRSTSRLRRT